MMKHVSLYAALGLACCLFIACASRKASVESEPAEQAVPAPTLRPIPAIHKPVVTESAALPAAVIYKTNGDFNDNVPVTLNATSTALLSFPAPGDVSRSSAPLPMAAGFLLDRRGIGENTAFTDYTYQQYASLPEAPDTATIMRSILPNAKVTVRFTLPFTLNEALADTAMVNEYIRQHMMR